MKNKILVIILIVFVLGTGYFFYKSNSLKPSNAYSAVFLNNQQVYFAKVDKRGDWVKISDIYYLQLKDPLQSQNSTDLAKNNPDLSLIKLGNELHGPKDMMEIPKSNILYIEELSDTSKVVQAIEQYKETH